MSSTASSTGLVSPLNGAARRTMALQVVDGPVVHRGHRDDLLREHVERIARHPQLFDRAGAHPLGHDRRLHEVALVLREDHAAGDVTDVVPGAAGPLQPARDRRR